MYYYIKGLSILSEVPWILVYSQGFKFFNDVFVTVVRCSIDELGSLENSGSNSPGLLHIKYID